MVVSMNVDNDRTIEFDAVGLLFACSFPAFVPHESSSNTNVGPQTKEELVFWTYEANLLLVTNGLINKTDLDSV